MNSGVKEVEVNRKQSKVIVIG